MSNKVSNVSAGVESGRRKDDKRDDRKPPRNGPSGVKKDQKRCYICNKTGHLQKDCPYQIAFREIVDRLMQDLPQPASAGQPLRAGPGPSRRRRTAARAASRVQDNGQQQQQNERELPERVDEDEKSKIPD
ncbi:uncharacterized protein BHQ10_005840 [Talaromyces amestolkiae]|uniref:CCHC-type domain-containing protein n=1 Tax=Talaromyces amestolkiae TaxID=1196081 RepID=A0A364L1Z6_TALAM|nr:uncharacterized protein BHQ10_005840 [Talaromyces amestolkiae]RAO69828.1 hypothetical protein BHQ10_005840 [Talaromyces amestolkiae]